MPGNRQNRIRNFCIIAHIDHGKSTLADRLMEETGVLTEREMDEQVLDTMDLERERGITIKAQAVRLVYKARTGEEYILNLIDTPGHVDFAYEVSRSLAACEGAVLVVDATQGIQAQTLANVYLAMEHDLDIVPVINKIDLPSARPELVRKEIEDVLGLDAGHAPLISAKNGTGITDVLDSIVRQISPPRGDQDAPLRALIFDSFYDSYRGVIAHVRVMEGAVRTGDRIRMMATGRECNGCRHFPSQSGIGGGFAGGRCGIYHGCHEGCTGYQGRGYGDACRPAGEGGASRISEDHSHGIQRYLSGRRRKVQRSEGCTGKAAAQ